MSLMTNTTSTRSDKVRSDIVCFETAAGSAVFSIGSNNLVCALAWKRSHNKIAQMTANVLHEFIRREMARA